MAGPRKPQGFGKALDRIRESERPSRSSFSDQLRLLDDSLPDRGRVPPARLSTMALPEGSEEENSCGRHYVVRKNFPPDYVHGKIRLDRADTADLSRLLELARCGHRVEDRGRIAFLDTETTGISGGAGTCPFLIGVGFYRGDEFRVVQYFIRDFDEESSMLYALNGLLADFDLLVTYNGLSFDAPMVENRCVLARLDSPFRHMAHFDLLFMARRLWRVGHGSCKLTALEARILSFLRGPDISGAMIPGAYFEYLRSSDAISLRSVFSHHVYDILSLAALTIHAADCVATEPQPLDDAPDLYSLGRIFDRAHDHRRSIRCYEMALDGGVPMALRIRAMERLSVLYRRTGNVSRSMELCGQLMVLDEFSAVGYEGAAMFQERHERNLEAACAVIRDALNRLRNRPGLERRGVRLRERLERLERKQQKGLFATGDPGSGSIEK